MPSAFTALTGNSRKVEFGAKIETPVFAETERDVGLLDIELLEPRASVTFTECEQEPKSSSKHRELAIAV